MFNARQYVRKLQRERAGMARRDYHYDLNRAKMAHNPAVRRFYLHEAGIDLYWSKRRIRSAKSGRPL